jgi:hypothetical protein
MVSLYRIAFSKPFVANNTPPTLMPSPRLAYTFACDSFPKRRITLLIALIGFDASLLASLYPYLAIAPILLLFFRPGEARPVSDCGGLAAWPSALTWRTPPAARQTSQHQYVVHKSPGES